MMKSNWLTRLIPVAAGVLFGLATGACTVKRDTIAARDNAKPERTGDTITVIDGAALERMIVSSFAERDLAVTVACPKTRLPKAGDTFTCEAIIEDETALMINFFQKDASGNAVWRFDGVIVDTRKDLVAIKAMLPASVVITCSKRVLYLKQVGDTASCDLRDGDHRARLVLSYEGNSGKTGNTGRFDVKVVPSES